MSSTKNLLKIYRALDRYFGDLQWWPAEEPFEVIIGAILTQNTNWKNVEKAIRNLKKEKYLDPEKLYRARIGRLETLIRPSGYYRVKARRLKKFLEFLFSEYRGQVESMFAEDWRKLRIKLLTVNGIGEETADSILLYAGHKPVFVVDQYTRRIFTRHGVIDGKENYQEIQRIIMSRFPVDVSMYNQYHALIVNTGKQFCKKDALCTECPLGRMMTTRTGSR
jgi:endonuclease-3 related protein